MELAFDRARKRLKMINLIPLINVVFLLLAFFLIAGHVQPSDAVALKLPIAGSGASLSEQEALTVLMGPQGELFMGDKPIATSELAGAAAAYMRAHPSVPVILKADAALESRKMLEVLQVLQQVGGANVSLVVQAGS